MADYDDENAHADLEKYGDAYRFQLVAACIWTPGPRVYKTKNRPLRKTWTRKRYADG